MAEPTDRPGPAPESYAARIPAAPQLAGDAPDLPAYRPLSVAAVVGLGLAVLYAVFLAVCVLAAWFSGQPLTLSGWAVLVPVVTLVVSALGWLQVQLSEGTRAGSKLAVWGIVVSLFAGLSYAAYFGASYTAVTQQAEGFGMDWLDLIKKGKIDEAFRETLPPEGRPRQGDNLHRQLELRFNSAPDGSFRGDLTVFAEGDVVRLINHGRDAEGGAETTIRPLGIRTWEPRPAGFSVEMTFEVATPARTVELLVAAVSTQGTDAGKGREWTVERTKTGPVRMVREEPFGNRLRELKESSGVFVDDWLKKLGGGQAEEAYQETQPPARRATLSRDYGVQLFAATLAPDFAPARAVPLTKPGAARRAYLAGYRDFAEGGLLPAGKDLFWAEGRLREQVPAAARQWFQRPAETFVPFLHMSPANLPLWERQGDRLRMYHLFEGNLFHQYLVQAAFVTDTDAGVLDSPAANPTWQLTSIELYNGRTMAAPRIPPQ